MAEQATSKKLTASIVVLVVLSLCLCVTTVALVLSMISVDSNIFHTGTVSINLNDSKPVIEEQECRFAPGMAIEKEFFIENNSTDSVYYRIYFDNVAGGLADILQVTISDGEKILYHGTARALARENVRAADDTLAIGERRTLTVTFLYPDGAGNETQDQILTFDLCAEAVQTKNNPERLFD